MKKSNVNIGGRKELTKSEVKSVIQNETSAYWLNSSPLFIAHQPEDQDEPMLFPLEEDFAQKNWLLCFFNPLQPLDFLGVEEIKRLFQNYSTHNLNFVFVIPKLSSILSKQDLVTKILTQFDTKWPTVLDHDFLISKIFKIQKTPTIALLAKTLEWQVSGTDCFSIETEKKIQLFLRSQEPGLSLPILNRDDFLSDFQIQNYDLNKILFSPQEPQLSSLNQKINVFYKGKWKKEEDFIYTEDPEAELKFYLNSTDLFLVLGTPQKNSQTKTLITLNNSTIIDRFAGESLEYEQDSGSSYLDVQNGSLYHVCTNLPHENHLVTLRAPFAHRNRLELYSIATMNQKNQSDPESNSEDTSWMLR